ncbi:MAG: bifunctional 4-hydroxy-2-oxoglutarate aldolase/2-dehydro-3-deoxy-phosphogluconate aldolase [Pirellulales bacterium]|nr:bifunctional 4-hydroxy-2-oxoglutarate aldolase/2-dehydro-3-deoxy-phosphogluconate aldolase [Pirellulales bacterium]
MLWQMTQTDTITARLRHLRVVPVIAIEDAAAALPLADALIDGGLPVAEITFRTEAAAEVIATLRGERPDLLVGAGTVLTRENVDAAKESGAQFAVAPGFNPDVVKHAQEVGLPFAPGVATPSDIEGSLALGLMLLKFFPAGALGGPAMLKAISAPYRHTGVEFMPTGGVNAENAAEYLAIDAVVAVGGTWIAKPEDLAEGRWDAIRERCAEIVTRVGYGSNERMPRGEAKS